LNPIQLGTSKPETIETEQNKKGDEELVPRGEDVKIIDKIVQ
jgi:hypothetical protein